MHVAVEASRRSTASPETREQRRAPQRGRAASRYRPPSAGTRATAGCCRRPWRRRYSPAWSSGTRGRRCLRDQPATRRVSFTRSRLRCGGERHPVARGRSGRQAPPRGGKPRAVVRRSSSPRVTAPTRAARRTCRGTSPPAVQSPACAKLFALLHELEHPPQRREAVAQMATRERCSVGRIDAKACAHRQP